MPVIDEIIDAENGTGTQSTFSAGDYFFGSLGTASDADWVAMSLVEGQTYTLGLMGVGALSDGLYDSYLRLRDASGSEIAFDDDGGPGRASTLTFTAASTGTFYADVQSYNNTEAGDYGLSLVEGNRASYDVMMGAGNLLRDDASWAATPETAVTVSWAIRASGTEPSGGNAFEALTAAQVGAVEMAMAYIDGISGLTFSQVNPGGTSNDATMLFGAYDEDDGSGAYAYFPGNTAASSVAGDVWLNNNAGSTTSLPYGSYSYFTVLHEIGHALGLDHPGEYNAAPGVAITYNNDAQFTEDTNQYTVMSYFGEGNTTTSVGGYPDTLMMFDILALHQLYGADYSFHSDDTVYGFNATVGGAYDLTENTNPLLSIWDGGGADTIDLSGYQMAQMIDLKDGAFSDVGGYEGNLSIAVGAVIENAVGGSGDDVITGNAAANTLTGGEGDDTLDGGAGDDTFVSGLGDDTFEGGADTDIAVFAGVYGAYTVTGHGSGAFTVTSTRSADAGTDQFSGVEELHFANGVFTDAGFNPYITTNTVEDTAGTRPWSSYTDAFDQSGARISREVIYDDGLEILTEYNGDDRTRETRTDGGSDFSWATLVRTFDEDGAVSTQDYLYDTGRARLLTYEGGVRTQVQTTDSNNASPWTTYTDNFDLDGTRTDRGVLFDNGLLSTTNYANEMRSEYIREDTQDVFNWVTLTQTFGSNGGLTQQENIYDDGRVIVTDYASGKPTEVRGADLADAYGWTSYVDDYDAAGERTQRTMIYDDGSEVTTTYGDDMSI